MQRLHLTAGLLILYAASSCGGSDRRDTFEGGGGSTKRRHNHGVTNLTTTMQSSPTTRVHLSEMAMSHPLCRTNVTAYVGQTAEMHCCLARLDRDLSVSWIRKRDVVVLSHGNQAFTSDNRVKASERGGIWTLAINKIGHSDGGFYECQTNTAVKTGVVIKLNIMETRAQITGKTNGSNRLIRAGSTLKLSCKVYLGPKGPDAHYRETAVVHWFHDQRLLDPELEAWQLAKSLNLTETSEVEGAEPRLRTGMEVTKTGIRGWLEVRRITPFDAGNYSCVPSYAIPDWTQVHIMHDDRVQRVYYGSEVKLGPSSNNLAAATKSSAYSNLLSPPFHPVALLLKICSLLMATFVHNKWVFVSVW